jgi:hypothetical protein
MVRGENVPFQKASNTHAYIFRKYEDNQNSNRYENNDGYKNDRHGNNDSYKD